MDTVFKHREEYVIDRGVGPERDDRRAHHLHNRSVRVPARCEDPGPQVAVGQDTEPARSSTRRDETRSRAISAAASFTDMEGGQVTGARRTSSPTNVNRGSNRLPLGLRSLASTAGGGWTRGT